MRKLLKVLNNKHFLSLLGNGSMAVLNMLVLAILYRFLSIEDNGNWIFYQTGIVLIDTFRTGVLNTAVVKFYAGATENRANEVIGSSWALAVIISLLFIFLTIPFLFFMQNISNEGVKIFLLFLPVNLVISIPAVITMCKAQAEQRFDRILYVRLLNNGLFLVLIVLLIFFKYVNIQTVIYVNLFAILITCLIVVISGWSGLVFVSKRNWKCVGELFHYGKFTVATSVSSSLFKVTDTFIINFMLGPAALAVYNIGQRLMEIIEIPLRSLTATAMPTLSAAFNQKKKRYFIHQIKRYIGVVTLCLLPFMLLGLLFADLAIGLIAGYKYQESDAGNVFRLFLAFSLLYPADRFFATALDAIHKPNINFLKIVIMLIINLVLDLVGISLFHNVFGITIATIFPVIFAVIFSYHSLRRYDFTIDLKEAYYFAFLEAKHYILRVKKQGLTRRDRYV